MVKARQQGCRGLPQQPALPERQQQQQGPDEQQLPGSTLLFKISSAKPLAMWVRPDGAAVSYVNGSGRVMDVDLQASQGRSLWQQAGQQVQQYKQQTRQNLRQLISKVPLLYKPDPAPDLGDVPKVVSRANAGFLAVGCNSEDGGKSTVQVFAQRSPGSSATGPLALLMSRATGTGTGSAAWKLRQTAYSKLHEEGFEPGLKVTAVLPCPEAG
jgi:hypothetical protein